MHSVWRYIVSMDKITVGEKVYKLHAGLNTAKCVRIGDVITRADLWALYEEMTAWSEEEGENRALVITSESYKNPRLKEMLEERGITKEKLMEIGGSFSLTNPPGMGEVFLKFADRLWKYTSDLTEIAAICVVDAEALLDAEEAGEDAALIKSLKRELSHGLRPAEFRNLVQDYVWPTLRAEMMEIPEVKKILNQAMEAAQDTQSDQKPAKKTPTGKSSKSN